MKVHFASLMDTCHLKNAELETKHQKYKGRVVLRGDIVKDDSGSYAVFIEQDRARIISITRCAGQAAGQVNGVPKAWLQQAAAADSRGSRTCVSANTFLSGEAHAGEARMN